ncbi:MAG: rRNA maturation RNase YbeY [Acidobacteria bacterium]|nr:rRNA maturation RNase YbeY [Acidobacteriota bacterium]
MKAMEVALLNQQRSIQIDCARLRSYLHRLGAELSPAPFTVALVSDVAIRRLNLAFRHKDSTTDVLSFHSGDAERKKLRIGHGERAPNIEETVGLGDIVIAAPTASRAAGQFGWTLTQELQALALHGLLHLMGYDHETDHGEMARAERRWGRRFGLPQTLLSRQYTKSRRPKEFRRKAVQS